MIIAGQVLWGVYEFLERFVGVRWYYPGELGLSVPRCENLIIKPVWLWDAPLFRTRINWPGNYPGGGELHRRLRQGRSWQNRISCHTPIDWHKYYAKDHPEYFQLRADGKRDFSMLCYSNPATLQRYLITIEEYYAGKYKDAKGRVIPGAWGWFPPDEYRTAVSPNNTPVVCYCPLCRAKWDKEAGSLGEASLIVADFVLRLAKEVKKRWPDKTVTYLAYSNYARPPKGIKFPGNVEVHICGMPAIANYKEPEIARSEQEIIDGWFEISGRKLQNWHYICWPDDSTAAPYLFPHVIKDFYLRNREKSIGTFISGSGNHWPRHHITLYCWMKVLRNPEFDVDSAIDEYCRRMYGAAEKTMRKLIKLQTDGWEKSRWSSLPPGHNVPPKLVHEETYLPSTVRKMKALLQEAKKTATDEFLMKRVEYYAGPFKAFFKESEEYHSGTGRTPLLVLKVGEDPMIDGKLDDAVWKRAKPVSFRRALDRINPEPRYPTSLRAVWTANGISFGFRMTEPEPGKLVIKQKAHDAPLL